MSLQSFQATMARLIVDPDFRDRVRAAGAAAGCSEPLSALEARRLDAIAVDPGLAVNRTLHKGFRLGKLRALLPLTCRVLGSRALLRLVPAFWAQRPPSSFYFLPEALEFCAFLESQRPRSRYLRDVLAYERATLELERAEPSAPRELRVHFEHDPAALLAALARGTRPRGIPRRPCTAIASRGEDGRLHWQLLAAHGQPDAPV